MWNRNVSTVGLIRNLAQRNAFRLSYYGVSCLGYCGRMRFSTSEDKTDPYAILFDFTFNQVRSIARALGFPASGTKEEIAASLKVHFDECQVPMPPNLREMFPENELRPIRSPDWPKLKELIASSNMVSKEELEKFGLVELKDLAMKCRIKRFGEQSIIDRLLVYFDKHDMYEPTALHSGGPNSGRERVMKYFGRSSLLHERSIAPTALDTPNELLHLMKINNLHKIARKLRLKLTTDKAVLIPQIIEGRRAAEIEQAAVKAFNQKEKHKMQPRISAFKKFIHTKHLRGPIVNADGKYTMERVLETIAHMRDRGTIPKPYVMQMIRDATELFRALPNVINLSRPVIAAAEGTDKSTVGSLHVVGDTLGDLNNLLHIFSTSVAGLPSDSNSFLFMGNMVNGGTQSFESLTTLLLLKLLNPNSVHLLRGLQETTLMNSRGVFQSQILRQYDPEVLSEFRRLFCALPVAAVIEKKAFVVHGGLGQQTGSCSVSSLNTLFNRQVEPSVSGPLTELLWAHPKDGLDGFTLNKTKGGFYFGPPVTRRFLHLNDLDLLIQAQDFSADGYDQLHNGRCLTVFSAPFVQPSGSNVGAILRFDAENPASPKVVAFEKTTTGAAAATSATAAAGGAALSKGDSVVGISSEPKTYRSSGLRGFLRSSGSSSGSGSSSSGASGSSSSSSTTTAVTNRFW